LQNSIRAFYKTAHYQKLVFMLQKYLVSFKF